MMNKLGSLKEFLPAEHPQDTAFTRRVEALKCLNASLVLLKSSDLNKGSSCNSSAVLEAHFDNSVRPTSQSTSLRWSPNPEPVYFSRPQTHAKRVFEERPDYSNVKSRVSSFRRRQSVRRQDSVRQRSYEAQQRIRNELMMKHEYQLLRTMKHALKQDNECKQTVAYADRGFNQLHKQFSALKARSPRPSSTSPSAKRNPAEETLGAPKTDVLRPRLAQRKSLDYDSQVWRQRRGLDVKDMHSSVQDFIKALFSLLDEQASGVINGRTLQTAFVNLGVSTDPSTLGQVRSR